MKSYSSPTSSTINSNTTPQSHGRIPQFHLPILFLLSLSLPFLHLAAAYQQSDSSSSDGDALDTTNVSPSMALIVIILVLAFFVTGCISIYLQQCAEPSPALSDPIIFSSDVLPTRSNVTRGLNWSVIESFPTFLYSAVKDLKLGKGSLECAVCLSEFRDDEILRLLPKCDHVFHSDCIDAWIFGHTTCPVCRANLVPDPGQNGKTDESPHEINSDSDLELSSSGDGIPRCEVQISINDGEKGGEGATRNDIPKQQLPRSHSTGHSLIRPGQVGDSERFTLRLPAEVRRQLLNRTKLKRALSLVALPRESSSRRGHRTGGGGETSGSSRYGGIFGLSMDQWSCAPFSSTAKVETDGDVTAESTGKKRFPGNAITPLESLPPLSV